MSFLRNLVLLTIGIALVMGVLLYYWEYDLVHPYAWYILLFFALITLGTFYAIRKGTEADPGSFQLYYLGSSVFRVLLCMMVVFIYVYLATERELQFAINFFVIYFIYTGFEIYGILSNLRRISKKQVSE
jgi:hypothetical protein